MTKEEISITSAPPPAGAQQAVADEREAFEAWFCEEGDYEPEWLHGRQTAAGFCYSNADTENMWQAWQARATRPSLQSLGGDAGVSEAMVDAYLQANDAYWKRTDQLPTPPDKWRTGTPREATRESLRAALSLTSTEKSDGWIRVEERLPESAHHVLACNACGYVGRAQWDGKHWNHIGRPTHWMPLPAAPKAAEKSGRSE